MATEKWGIQFQSNDNVLKVAKRALDEAKNAYLQFQIAGKGQTKQAIEQKQKVDELSKAYKNLRGSVSDGLSTFQALNIGDKLSSITRGFIEIGRVGAAAFSSVTSAATDFINEANKLQSAELGLGSVAKFKGIDKQSATDAVQNLELVKNGLLTVGDASLALKNLLASNFTLEQSIELIKRFGDSAAFGRQSSLEFGYAVTSATEGIKNQNSILVDNAGVTKNLSLILKEAGFSEQDLGKLTSDTAVRTALYNGILKETQGQLGDAIKLTETFQGKQAKLEAQITTLKQEFGSLLQQGLTPFLDKIVESDGAVKSFAGGIITVGGALGSLLPVIASLKLAFPALFSTILSGLAPVTAGIVAIGTEIGLLVENIKYGIAQIQASTGVFDFVKRIFTSGALFPYQDSSQTQPVTGMGDLKKTEQEMYETEQNRKNEIQKQADIEKQSGEFNLANLKEQKKELEKMLNTQTMYTEGWKETSDKLKQINAQIKQGEIVSGTRLVPKAPKIKDTTIEDQKDLSETLRLQLELNKSKGEEFDFIDAIRQLDAKANELQQTILSTDISKQDDLNKLLSEQINLLKLRNDILKDFTKLVTITPVSLGLNTVRTLPSYMNVNTDQKFSKEEISKYKAENAKLRIDYIGDLVDRSSDLFGNINNIFNTLGIETDAWAAKVIGVFQLTSSFLSFGKGILGILSFIPGLSFLQMFRAEGGAVSMGKPYIVGEKGAELMIPRTDGYIMKNSDLMSMLGNFQAGHGKTDIYMNSNINKKFVSYSIAERNKNINYYRVT